MPRAHRCYLPGHVWHVTHRCHDRAFLLREHGHRDRWERWLQTAQSRVDVSVLDFVVTSNHVHVLVFDPTGTGGVGRLMQLVQGHTAQSYNRRHGRRGAYWEDRYHAAAIESGEHLWRCLVYIDLNMVRAGVVDHPRDWPHAGYHQIQGSKPAVSVDLERLAALTGCVSAAQLRSDHRAHIEDTLAHGPPGRQPDWTEAIAIGSEEYTNAVRARLGLSRLQRMRVRAGETYVLREERAPYRAGRSVPRRRTEGCQPLSPEGESDEISIT